MMICKVCVVLISQLVLVSWTPQCVVAVQTEEQAMMYLSKYGYLGRLKNNQYSNEMISEKTMTKAIIDFQSFVGINSTGHLDEDTLHYMSLPRCGLLDKMKHEPRSKRYTLSGVRWTANDLTYTISKYPKQLSISETNLEIQKAFKLWSDVTPLTFTRKENGQVDINIRFEKGAHGDKDSFDGPGGTLAHSTYPSEGHVHFDDSEEWTIGSYKGINLFEIAVHEFGHALGLNHSKVQSSVMIPHLHLYNPRFKLDIDDVKGIQAIYGASSSSEERDRYDYTNQISTEEEESAESCPKVDAVFQFAFDTTFVFKGDNYWEITGDGRFNTIQGIATSTTSLKPIADTWSGLPGRIDAAFKYYSKTYFFKGTKVWKYTDTTMDDGYPKAISKVFNGVPDNIDGAFVWSGDGEIYFFKGAQYWKYRPINKKSSSPKSIKKWRGVPSNIDAVVDMSMEGYSYFFKDQKLYKFDNSNLKVSEIIHCIK